MLNTTHPTCLQRLEGISLREVVVRLSAEVPPTPSRGCDTGVFDAPDEQKRLTYRRCTDIIIVQPV